MIDTAGVYPGDWRITDVFADHATLANARFDRGAEEYLVTVTPLEERLAVRVAYSKRQVYLPLVLRGSWQT